MSKSNQIQKTAGYDAVDERGVKRRLLGRAKSGDETLRTDQDWTTHNAF